MKTFSFYHRNVAGAEFAGVVKATSDAEAVRIIEYRLGQSYETTCTELTLGDDCLKYVVE